MSGEVADTSLRVVVLCGPNGAGKSTVAPRLLRGSLAVDEFVNADTIASGLSAFAPERVAMTAGRVMLARLDELEINRVSFAFETTLASRAFAPRLRRLTGGGYMVHLVYLWLPDADSAIARVRERVRSGGHSVPEEVIRRRYAAGIRNFMALYRPLTHYWRVVDNTGRGGPRLIAMGRASQTSFISRQALWRGFIAEGSRDQFPES